MEDIHVSDGPNNLLTSRRLPNLNVISCIRLRSMCAQVQHCQAIKEKICKRKEKADDTEKRRLSFLYKALDCHERGEIDIEDLLSCLREEVATLMFARHDATASIIFFTMYFLGRHPHVLRKAQEEIDSLDGFLIESSIKCRPFAYVPFSAGPRNCIGQRFALLEEKMLLSNFLRHYDITSLQDPEQIDMSAETILGTRNGLSVKISQRMEF
eukprot:gene8284-14242_t